MGELLSRSSPTPPQELADKGIIKTNPQCTNRQSAQAYACFCSRERLGTTKTPSAKKVENVNFHTVGWGLAPAAPQKQPHTANKGGRPLVARFFCLSQLS